MALAPSSKLAAADWISSGENLRSSSAEITAALSRQGRYTTITANMRVKEVRVSDSERFVICHNPEAADRDAHVREQLLAQLRELIAGSDGLTPHIRGELAGRISTKPGLHRFLRTTPAGSCVSKPRRSRPRPH